MSRGVRGGRLEHGAVIGADERLEEAFAVQRERLGGEPSVFRVFQDEGAQEDFATGFESAL